MKSYLYLRGMKDKTIYFIDPNMGQFHVDVSFKELWELSREGKDVPPTIRLEHIQDCVKAGKDIDVMVGSILHQLCFLDKKPKDNILYFHNPLYLN